MEKWCEFFENERIRDVHVGKDVLKIELADGRVIAVPLRLVPDLAAFGSA